jgi:hypothetical protein
VEGLRLAVEMEKTQSQENAQKNAVRTHLFTACIAKGILRTPIFMPDNEYHAQLDKILPTTRTLATMPRQDRPPLKSYS